MKFKLRKIKTYKCGLFKFESRKFGSYATFCPLLLVSLQTINMKIVFLILGLMAISLFGCKKEEATVTFNGDGFIYYDGSPFTGGVGWYFAESRTGQWKALPLKESQLPADYKNITVADSIAVTVSLEKTKTPASCDCVAGSIYLYDILSIRKR
jgi:hypothetical protein